MDFLKELLGDELFATVQKKIEEHNADEKNKDNQIKIGNLGRGDYVARGKFLTETEKLNNMIANKDLEIGEAIFSNRVAAPSEVLEKEWALKITLAFSSIREATCVFLPISIPK